MTAEIIAWGQVAGAVATILALAGLLVKWTIIKPLKSYIDHATYPIQPQANGGKSLPDVVARLDAVHDLVKLHIDTHDKS